MRTRYCPTCRDERPVEQPPCLDGHLECPEWVCLHCDTVFFAGWLSVDCEPRVDVPRVETRLTSAA